MLHTSVAPWPNYTEEEQQAVAQVLASGRVNYWTGEEARTFEREYAQWAESERAVALFNGTVALDLALRALEIGPGDEVIVTPRTFIASISCVTNVGRNVGTFGRIGCWSFCQDKIITTGGEGGMVTTDDSDLWSRMWSFKDHGKSWDAVYERQHPPGYRWLHESFGTNYRMIEIQA